MIDRARVAVATIVVLVYATPVVTHVRCARVVVRGARTMGVKGHASARVTVHEPGCAFLRIGAVEAPPARWHLVEAVGFLQTAKQILKRLAFPSSGNPARQEAAWKRGWREPGDRIGWEINCKR